MYCMWVFLGGGEGRGGGVFIFFPCLFLHYGRNPNSFLALSLNDESLYLCQTICDIICKTGCCPECATLMPHLKNASSTVTSF